MCRLFLFGCVSSVIVVRLTCCFRPAYMFDVICVMLIVFGYLCSVGMCLILLFG